MRFRRVVNFLAIAILLLSVARLMARNRSHAATPPPAAIDPLAARVPPMHFRGNFRSCVAELSRASSVPVEIDPAVIHPLPLDSFRYNFDSPPCTLGHDLNVLLSCWVYPPRISVEGDRVRIVRATNQPVRIRIYDVSDIWQKLSNQLWARELAGAAAPPKQSAGGQSGLFGGIAQPYPRNNPASWRATQNDAMQDITRAIQTFVSSDDWIDQGGSTGWINGANGYVVVCNSAAAHRRIEELLHAIRLADTISNGDQKVVQK